MIQTIRQWFLMAVLMLVSLSALASQPNEFGLYTDGGTWTIPNKESPTNYVAAVYKENQSVYTDAFQVIYVGKGGRSPLGYQLNVVTPEVINTDTGSLINIKLHLGPYLYKDFTAVINRGNAEIDTRHNSRESIDWVIEHLTKTREEYEKTIGTKEEVGYVTVYIQAVENRLELVGTSHGDQLVRTGNVEERAYTFGTRFAREAILAAKANWDR